MVWLIILGILILLGFMQVGVIADYDEHGAGLLLSVGPFRIRLYPNNKSAKKNKQESAKAKKKSATGEQTENKEKGTLDDFLSVVQFVLEILSDFRRKIRINDLQLKLILAGGDPCDLSVNYGRAWAALGSIIPQIERLFVIRKRNVEVQCDYLADKTLICARIHITITVARLLSMIVYHGVRGLRKYYKIIKQIKGGATT